MVKPKDSLEIEMPFFEKGKGVTSLVTTNSEDRSLIGSYFNAEKKARNNGDASRLEKFQNITIIDADSNAHEFETDLDVLYDIHEQQEDPELFEIYEG